MKMRTINWIPETWLNPMGISFFKQLLAMIRSTRTVRALLLVPYLLAISTVFVINDGLANGVVSGKYFWFHGSMGLVCATILIGAMMDKRLPGFLMKDWLVLLFAITVYASAFLSGDARQNTTKLTILAMLLVLYCGARMVINIFNRKKIVQNAFSLFIVFTGLVEAVWGLLQLYGIEPSRHSLFRLTGSFFNPGPYAGYLSMVFPMALWYWIRETRREACKEHPDTGKSGIMYRVSYTLNWGFACITCLAILLVLPSTMSRASWLAVIAGSVVVLCARYSKQVKNFYMQHKKQARIAGCVIVLLLFAASTGLHTSLFEPIHGSYPQAAGRDVANPVASILSAAMMFEIAFSLPAEGAAIRRAVEETLSAGIVTEDLLDASSPLPPVGTEEMGDRIAARI